MPTSPATTTTPASSRSPLAAALTNETLFADRHIGPDAAARAEMLAALGHASLDALVDATVPTAIRLRRPLELPRAASEAQALGELREIASENEVRRSFIGLGYHDTVTPPVIQRNILENPGWYTSYTPYQAEIAQGRLEALLNFQTMVIELTAMEVANASLLDEATAAAEAMFMAFQLREAPEPMTFFVASGVHPQTLAVVRTRAEPLGIRVLVGDPRDVQFGSGEHGVFGVLVQYPATDGGVDDLAPVVEKAHAAKAIAIFATDLLALTLLKPPGEIGADICIGSAQRFGVPLGFGGPHAAFMTTRAAYQRKMPGRIVGVSKDREGRPAIRLALQTREQHIRRDKATSNICTAQALLASIASSYAVYHGPEGLTRIASRVHALTALLDAGLRKLYLDMGSRPFFDTLRVPATVARQRTILERGLERDMNFRAYPDGAVGVALDETATEADVTAILECFAPSGWVEFSIDDLKAELKSPIGGDLRRTSKFLAHPTFSRYHSETEMLRYLKKLESRDISLTHSMIPLGSCTMKLNATAELMPVTWPEIGRLHPFAPASQTAGYARMFADLEEWLGEITGFDAVSLQPNAGANGEYAGLLAIRAWHRGRGDTHRSVCLIPKSAHGTNPASAAIAGMTVVPVECDAQGNVDLADLAKKAAEHAKDLSALMVTYPSTHGVFEGGIREICDIVHRHGGQVYMDGANMNAQVGLCRPGDFGPDVCHLNLHKTFCIPHGGGGPGVGPICVKAHLAPYLPGHPLGRGEKQLESAHGGPVAAAPWGSASILPISWMYIRMMGGDGLKAATQVAILNANYIAHRLAPHFPILYRGKGDLVAHECILDCHHLKKEANVEVEDVAKRLADYGFHAPTVSFPVPGTVMVEPTESESKEELDRFCEAMIAIREEAREISTGKADAKDNVLKNAPHTAAEVCRDEWKHGYSREKAAFPAPWTRERKYWPAVARIDSAYGDRNLFCTCVPMQ